MDYESKMRLTDLTPEEAIICKELNDAGYVSDKLSDGRIKDVVTNQRFPRWLRMWEECEGDIDLMCLRYHDELAAMDCESNFKIIKTVVSRSGRPLYRTFEKLGS